MNPSLAPRIQSANFALFSEKDLERIGEFFSTDYIAHTTGDDMKDGRKGIRRFLTKLQTAFPEIQIELEILVENGDRISWQRTLRGVQKGPFAGFPATHREVVWRDMVCSRFDGELIVEEWVLTDLAERLLLARK